MSDQSTGSDLENSKRSAARRRTTAVFSAVALLVVVLLVTVGVAANSTAGCSACHAAQSQALAESAHATVACNTCHAAPPRSVAARMDVVLRMLPASIGGVTLDGPGKPIGSAPCTSCHTEVMSGGVVAKNGLRIDHQACTSHTSCSACHSRSSHGSSTRIVRAPSMSECTACHLAQGASTACETCHEGTLAADRTRDPVWVRTHGPDWESAHGLGDLRTCTMCHASGDCEKCHGAGVPHSADFGATHGNYALETGKDKCLTCHRTAAFCEGCHKTEMPHPAGFLQKHSSTATSVEDPTCAPCHPLEDCQSCHAFHVHPGGTQPPIGREGKG